MASLSGSNTPAIDDSVAGVVEVFGGQEVLNLLPHTTELGENYVGGLKVGVTNLISPAGDLSQGRKKLSLIRGSLTALCQWGLPEGYISDDLFDSAWDDEKGWHRRINAGNVDGLESDHHTQAPTNLILILYDRDQYQTGGKNPGSIRGIALCNVNSERMKLLVLGAIRPSANIRGRHFARGGQLLRAVQFLGSTRNYIELYALETVITLYYKFNWRFIDPDHCGLDKPSADTVERGKYGGAVKALRNLFKSASPGDPDEDALTKALFAFRSFASGRAGFVRLGKKGSDATVEARSNGYRMILCVQDNPYHHAVKNIILSQQHQGAGKEGGRRRRKRTKKKALKKKHRRTKRRKRKTRRKRGGKRKLSNKKCKILRHQHSKLTHHVNMVGKALQVQCKKRL
jgi:hypothetical protein